MKRPFERRSPGSLAVSVAIHVAIIATLVQIVFRYPLGQLMGITKQEVTPERIQFVKLPMGPTAHSGGGTKAPPTKGAAPAPIQPPAAVPISVPLPIPLDSAPAKAAGGTGTGFGVSSSELATGVVPRQPDSRIAIETGPMRIARTKSEDVDSIVSLAVGIYNDSVGLYARQQKPGDWTKTRKNGDKYGVDQKFIYIGKYKIPTALLALLPLNASSPVSPIEARSAAFIRRDVLENAQRSISEDEFRTAVKRIRERKEREKRQRQLASDAKSQPPSQP